MDNYQTFVDRLQGIVAKQPDKTAVTFLQDGETESDRLSYQDLESRIKAIAATLRQQNATGERALLLYQPGWEFITAFLGCLYAGVVAVPAYPPRANHSINRLLSIVDDADAKFALTTHNLQDKIEAKFKEAENYSLKFIATDTITENFAANWSKPDNINSDSLAFLQYTSGSTGNPKGVMVSHGNILANSATIKRYFQILPQHSVLSWLPPYHDMGLIGGILQPLYLGISMYMMPPVSFLQRPYRWLKTISKYKIDTSGAPNFAYDLCVNQVTEEQKASLDLSSWKLAFSGAEPIRAITLEGFSEYFSNCGFSKQAFYPCYGMAESTLIITGADRHQKPVVRKFQKQSLEQNLAIEIENGGSSLENQVILTSSGRNNSEQHLAIVNTETLEQCQDGEIGEIWVHSASVAQGYWNKPELTEYAFQAKLAAYPNVNFLRTGDLGFIRDEELFVTGRLKDLIIIRGRNHYPQDIELTVDRGHDAIRSGACAACAVDIEGKEELVVVAEVKRTHLRKLDVTQVTKAIRQAILQNHELNPHAIVLIKTTSIPKTSSGKIQRHACKNGFLDGSLKVVGQSVKQETVGEKTHFPQHQLSAIETWLVDNIAQRLGVNSSEIDIEETFASLGLDSVQAVRLSAELEDYLQVKLSPTLVYDYPNISSLAAYLGNSHIGSSQSPIPNLQSSISNHQPIAIIGMGCRFPGANSPQAFWKLLRDGKDDISLNPRWQGSDYGGFIVDVDKFDPQFFGITPREAQRMDPQQRLLLEVSWEALENAAIAANDLADTPTGVFVGISSNDYSQLQMHYGTEFDAYGGTGNAHSIAANRLSYSLDLRGPSLSVDTACSSSLVAVHLACQSLRNGECSTAIAGGVNLMLSPELTQTFSLAGMMAADGKCKTFDADADGYVRGEGCGVVILKGLDDAIRDGDKVLAVVKGSAVNQDGKSNGLTAPNSLAQQAVIRQAIANSQIKPQDISYIEAHGTGTKLGDPIEVSSLKTVLNNPSQTCYLASVKTNIGHLEAAAGMAGLIKTVLCLQHSAIPPHLNFNSLNPHIDLTDTSFSIPTQLQEWQQIDKPRFAGISSFGFGGTNAHVIVGDAAIETRGQGDKEVLKDTALHNKGGKGEVLTRPLHLLTLSAKNHPALKDLVEQYQNYIQSNSDVAIEDICFTANTGRSHFNHRLAISAKSISELPEKLANYLSGKKKSGIVSNQIDKSNKPKIAWLFTGQGSQYEGMGYQLYQTQPKFRETLDYCAKILQPYLDVNLIEVIYPSEENKAQFLNQTQYTQPAIFALEYSLAQMWLSWGVKPDIVMGHSVGEYVAAAIAGVFSLEDGLKLIGKRGKLMQALPRNGEMFAVFADEGTVDKLIKSYSDKVAIAAINGKENIVISGDSEAIKQIINQLSNQGISSKKLIVSHAFHSPLMQPMVEDFQKVAKNVEYHAPQINLVSNVTGKIIEREIANPEYWVNHVIAPVKFDQGIKLLQSQKYNVFLEIGAKPILLGMGRNILESNLSETPELSPLCLPSLRPRKSDWSQISKSLATLYVKGVNIDWKVFERDYSKQKLQLPTYPFQRKSYWLEKNSEVQSSNSTKIIFNDIAEKSALDYYQISWQKSSKQISNLIPKLSATGKWIIFADRDGLGEQIARNLHKQNQSYTVVYPQTESIEFTKNTLQIDYRNLEDFNKVIGLETEIQGIIYLWSTDDCSKPKLAIEDINGYQQRNCTSILNLIQALFIKGINAPIWLVTRGAQDVENSNLTAASINAGSLWGLGKVIASEHPEYYGGIIDLEVTGETTEAETVISIINNFEQEDYLVLRQNHIYLPRLTQVKSVKHKSPVVNSDSCYLITGGLGALGLQVTQLLVEKGAKHLLLMGRSHPSVEVRETIYKLETTGVDIEVIQGDISDFETVKNVISQSPNLKGIIHAAGTLDDGLLQNQTWEKFQKVLNPKVVGAWNLHECSKNIDLDFFVLFSSVASLIGSPGQGNYATANASLDAIAIYRQSMGLTATSINWGAWDSSGMAVNKNFKRQGIELIQPQQGLGKLAELLTTDATQVGVLAIDWNKLSQQFPYIRESNYFSELITVSEPAREKNHKNVYQEIIALTPEAREEYLKEYLKNAIANILRLEPENLPLSESIFDLGADSLMLMETINQIKDDLNLMLYPREFYERPRIDSLAKYLALEFTKTHDKSVISEQLPVSSNQLPVTKKKGISNQQVTKITNPIAFILSSPRSGSTLLRVMLAGHPDIASPPELHLLPFNTMSERQEELEVSYLGEGLQKALMDLKGIDGHQSQELIENLVNTNASIPEVYEMLQGISGDRLLIDKSPTYASNRETLERAEAIFTNAKYIHLVRHPYAVIESFARMRMDKLISSGNSDPYQVAESIWSQSNQNILDFATKIAKKKVFLIHYEELVAQPEKVMREVCDFLEIPFNNKVLTPYQGNRMTEGVTNTSMSIGDPNFLNRKQIDANLAESWRKITLPFPLDYLARHIAKNLNYELPQEEELTSEIEHKMEEILVNIRGLRVCLCTWGPKEGPIVLCLHGILEQGAAWSEVAIRLAQKGYRVVAPDLRGHGRSDRVGKGGSYNLMDFLGDIDAIVEVLAGKAFTLVGHSLGSVVAAIFASVRPQLVKHIVLIETILPTEPPESETAEQLATHLDYLASPPEHPIFPDVEAAATRLRQATPAISKSLAMMLAQRITEPCEGGVRWRWEPLLRTRAGMAFNGIGRSRYLGLLKRIKAPITLVYGDKSNFNRHEDLSEQQAAMPNAQKVVLSGGHNLPLEEPQGIAKIISSAVALTTKLIP